MRPGSDRRARRCRTRVLDGRFVTRGGKLRTGSEKSPCARLKSTSAPQVDFALILVGDDAYGLRRPPPRCEWLSDTRRALGHSWEHGLAAAAAAVTRSRGATTEMRLTQTPQRCSATRGGTSQLRVPASWHLQHAVVGASSNAPMNMNAACRDDFLFVRQQETLCALYPPDARSLVYCTRRARHYLCHSFEDL